MSDRQYRTLRKGDVRLPGYEVRRPWVPGDSWQAMIPGAVGKVITDSDANFCEYRVPCSESVAPDGYEVVQRERLPKRALVQGTWMRWYGSKWRSMARGGWLVTDSPQAIYAAPADELRELYAQGDAEREQPAALSAEQIAAYRAALRRSSGAVSVGDDHLPALLDAYEARVAQEQPATAPTSPWVSAAERQPPVDATVPVTLAGHPWIGQRWCVRLHGPVPERNAWLDLAAVDRLAAENAALVRERDEARAEMADARRGWDAAAKERDKALADAAEIDAVLDVTIAARDAALAEVERLRGEVEARKIDLHAKWVEADEWRKRITAARAALEGRADG